WRGRRDRGRGVAVALAHAFGAEAAGEGAAAPDLARDLQPRLVQVQDVLDDRQAQTGAAGFARAAGRDPVEALGDPRQVRLRDAVAAVAHRQRRAAVFAAHELDGDPPAGRGVAHGVGDEVGERAVQLAGGTEQVDAGAVLDVDVVAPLAQRLGFAAQ